MYFLHLFLRITEGNPGLLQQKEHCWSPIEEKKDSQLNFFKLSEVIVFVGVRSYD